LVENFSRLIWKRVYNTDDNPDWASEGEQDENIHTHD